MISKFKEINAIITEINGFINNGLYNEAWLLSQKAIEEYSYSTELYILYLRLAQMTDQNAISLGEIRDQYFAIMKFQQYSNLDVIIDSIGICHNTLDEKSEELEIIFSNGYDILLKNMKDYTELYFDYLSEIGREREIEDIKNEIILTISEIPSDLTEDVDFSN